MVLAVAVAYCFRFGNTKFTSSTDDCMLLLYAFLKKRDPPDFQRRIYFLELFESENVYSQTSNNRKTIITEKCSFIVDRPAFVALWSRVHF